MAAQVAAQEAVQEGCTRDTLGVAGGSSGLAGLAKLSEISPNDLQFTDELLLYALHALSELSGSC